MIEHALLDSPIGRLHLFARNGALVFLDLRDDSESARGHVRRRFGEEPIVKADNPAGAVSALRRYFDGELAALDGVPADPGGTIFQASVWRALRAVKPGSTISYRDLAREINAPNAVRAVGAANGANPVPLVIPCHRVIGTGGRLVGYGGGLERKDWLLRHEGWRPLAP